MFFPVLRHLGDPGDTGGAEAGVGMDAACDGMGDNGLPQLFEALYLLGLTGDIGVDLPHLPLDIRHNGALLGKRREGDLNIFHFLIPSRPKISDYATSISIEFLYEIIAAKEKMVISLLTIHRRHHYVYE